MKNSIKKSGSLALLLGVLAAPQASALTLEDLAKRLDALEAKNKQLEQENSQLRDAVATTNDKVEAAVIATESIADSASGIQKLADWADKTSIGGYGELHYNNLPPFCSIFWP
ncbi:MAG: bZIP transcription factor [Cycloclasticus pugetii]